MKDPQNRAEPGFDECRGSRRNVGPQLSGDNERQVSYIHCCDDKVRRRYAGIEGLGSDQYVAVQLL